MLAVFSTAIVLSAGLLFLVQPMVAKMVLPRMGGSPAVWVTCMVFFQAVLLAGYGYSHLLSRRLPHAVQVIVHAAVIAAAFLFLPIELRQGWDPPGAARTPPALWLLMLLLVSVAGPFFVVSTTAPLLQRWFSSTDHRDAKDPYFLYAASNAGSLAALLAYPLVIERWLPLSDATAHDAGPIAISQSGVWAAGFGLFGAMVVVAGALALRRRRAGPAPAGADGAAAAEPGAIAAAGAGPAPSLARRTAWVCISFIPSSLMLGVTSHISTDVASAPLLWIIPLTLYLLSFIIAFSRRGEAFARRARWVFLVLALLIAAAYRLHVHIRPGAGLLLVLHPAALFAAALAWHGRLAQLRPDSRHLTEFYFLMSLGGVLGGIFNALVAPALFPEVYEYPLVLVLATLLARPGGSRGFLAGGRAAPVLDVVLPLALAGGLIAADLWFARRSYIPGRELYLEKAVLPGLVCALCLPRPARFAGCLAVMFVLSFWRPGHIDRTLYTERTFFGVNRVALTEPPAVEMEGPGGVKGMIRQPPFHSLYHGVTSHGTQFLDEAQRRVPTAYFHRSGPLGQVFEVFGERPVFDRIAITGLGAGTIAAYGRPGQSMTFYEIDSAVIRIATDPRYFTYIEDSLAEVACIEADGRMGVSHNDDASLGCIILDAFSSDSIPVHLVTREAFELYLSKLAPGGIIVVNISNYYMDMRPVLGAISLRLGLVGFARDDDGPASPKQYLEDKRPSTWVVMARGRDDLEPLPIDTRWRPLVPRGEEERIMSYLWTDDRSNMLRIVRRYW